MSNTETLETTCCIAGGGPAGVMLGYLLARSGVHVTVLEKHKDFNRDFRGDTVHPSSLEVLYELGLLDDLLRLPHQEVQSAGGMIGDFEFQAADFRHLPTHCKFVALMPQWDFLNFLAGRAKIFFPNFELRMQHEVVELASAGDRITGVVAQAPDGQRLHIRAPLVVGCDGRHSATRAASQLPLKEFGVPMDVLWFHIGRRSYDPENVLGIVNFGKGLVLIDRGDYFQAGLIVPKGSFDEIRRSGLDAFRASIVQSAPFLGGRVDELRDWEQVKVLTVQLNRLQRWHRPGLLCIGDAAHAMSPAGGVGINLAIQDAVATANILTGPLLEGRLTEDDLAKVQRRRELPTRITQAVQVFLHKRFEHVFQNPGPLHVAWQIRVALNLPGVHRALGRVVGLGFQPEHVRGARQIGSRGRKPSRAIRIGAALGATLGTAVHIVQGIKVQWIKVQGSQRRGPRLAA